MALETTKSPQTEMIQRCIPQSVFTTLKSNFKMLTMWSNAGKFVGYILKQLVVLKYIYRDHEDGTNDIKIKTMH